MQNEAKIIEHLNSLKLTFSQTRHFKVISKLYEKTHNDSYNIASDAFSECHYLLIPTDIVGEEIYKTLSQPQILELTELCMLLQNTVLDCY